MTHLKKAMASPRGIQQDCEINHLELSNFSTSCPETAPNGVEVSNSQTPPDRLYIKTHASVVGGA